MSMTIGQRILTQTICHYLAISDARAWELHVQGRKPDPSWEEFGEKLLESMRPAPGAPTIGERLCAAVIGFRLEASTDLVLKYLVQGMVMDPRWDEAGEKLLRTLSAPVGPSHESGKAN